MTIKVAQNDFTRKMIDFETKGFKKLPKVQKKSPNLTLVALPRPLG